MAKQASLLLVSRGVVDCEGHGNSSSGGFGLERVKDVFLSSPTIASRPLCDSILEAVAEFSGKGPICDDRTALALIRTA